MVLSKNLEIFRENDIYYVYHKMYGNLSVMDEKTYELLTNFDERIKYSESENRVLRKFIENYFINESEDEEYYLYKQEKVNRKLSQDGRLLIGLQLVMSNFCNFNCRYCFLNDEHKLRDNSEANAPSNMGFEIARKAIDFMINNIIKNNNGVLSIEFFGGEPLINWSVIKKILDFYGNEKKGVEFAYTITTNGSLINEEMITYFERYNFSVIVSYDSPSSTERLTKNNKTLNEVLFPILKKMKYSEFSKSFNSVISRFTLENYDFKGLVDIALKYKIDNIGLILDLDADFLEIGYTLDDVANIILDAYWYGKSRGINVTGYWEKMFLQINNDEDLFLTKGYKACPALGCKMSVEPSGDMFVCKCCPTKIGEIDNPEYVLQGKEYYEYINRVYKNSESCEHCELHNFCSGVCVGALEKLGYKYGRNPQLCYLYKKITKEIIKGSLDKIEKITLGD